MLNGIDHMPDLFDKNICCAFTGHRPDKLDIPERRIRALLKKEILAAYRDGFTVFISGAAEGVDLWAADIVIKLRKSYPDIKLICAVPFPDQKKTSAEYNQIIENADEVVIVCRHYFKGCFQVRNKWMVDHCSRLIAVWNGQPGGTKNTIDYAKRQQVVVINVLE